MKLINKLVEQENVTTDLSERNLHIEAKIITETSSGCKCKCRVLYCIGENSSVTENNVAIDNSLIVLIIPKCSNKKIKVPTRDFLKMYKDVSNGKIPEIEVDKYDTYEEDNLNESSNLYPASSLLSNNSSKCVMKEKYHSGIDLFSHVSKKFAAMKISDTMYNVINDIKLLHEA